MYKCSRGPEFKRSEIEKTDIAKRPSRHKASKEGCRLIINIAQMAVFPSVMSFLVTGCHLPFNGIFRFERRSISRKTISTKYRSVCGADRRAGAVKYTIPNALSTPHIFGSAGVQYEMIWRASGLDSASGASDI